MTDTPPEKVRLQKFLASHTSYSRRNAERYLIEPGRVTVNGTVVTEMGFQVDPEHDVVAVDGQVIETGNETFVYLMLNKPGGYLSTMDDPQGRPCVAQLLPSGYETVFHVGRLDCDTTGLLLFTNDGEMGKRLLAPASHVYKRYRAEVDGRISETEADILRRGITLDDGPCAPAEVVIDRCGPTSDVTCVIHEGRKRQVKRMFSAIGHPVLMLHRDQFGPLELGDLGTGQVRRLSRGEIEALAHATGLER